MLEWISLGVFALVSAVGFALIFFGMPGGLLIASGAVLVNIVQWNWVISPLILLLLFALGFLGEIIEFFVLAQTARKMSRNTLFGFLLGAVIGGFFGSILPVIGTIFGAIIFGIAGAYVFDWLKNKNIRKTHKEIKKFVVRKITCIGIKILIAAVQIVIVFLSL